MQKKTIIMIIASVIATALFIAFSSAVSSTETIWIMTRAFGLLSFLFLFITLILGEARMLAKDKSRVPLFRYHKPVAIFTTFLVLLHFISAVSDNFKWGKSLHFSQFLGFTFTDKYLVFLSFGTLAFYLMLLIGLTSSPIGIRTLGFKRWKVIHYLSYASFIIAYMHAVNVGTDLHNPAVFLEPYVHPAVLLMFAVIIGLFITRLISSFPVFDDQREVNLAAAFIIILLVLTASIAVEKTKTDAATAAMVANLEQQTVDAKAPIAQVAATTGATAGNVTEAPHG